MNNKNIKTVIKMNMFCALFIFGCNYEYEIPIIKANDIFNIEDNNYYVLIYLNGCVACRDVKLKISKLNQDYKEKFYYIDLEDNKELLHSEFVSNVGCFSYEDIKIKKTPTLFYIENKIIVEEYVNSTNILSFLNKFNI